MTQIDPLLATLVRASLALLFGHGAWVKARNIRAFAGTFRAYEILPACVSGAAAIFIVIAEGMIAAGLLIPRTYIHASTGASVLLLVYAAAIAINLRRGRHDLDCGCRGPASGGKDLISAWMVGRNLLLAGLITLATLPSSGRPLTTVDAITLVAAFTATLLLYQTADRWSAL